MHNIRSKVEALRKQIACLEREVTGESVTRRSPSREQILTALRTKDRAKIAPFRTVYVDVNGNDNTGDGTLLNPYASIQKGVDEANAISVNNVFVALGPGTYLENNPVVLPNNTILIGWDNDSWVASPQNLGADMFQVSAANADVAFVNGAIVGLGTTGAGINQSGVGTTAAISNFTMRDVTTGFQISNGAMVCDNVELSELDSIVTGFDVSNGATLSIALNRAIDDATVTTVYNIVGANTFCNIVGPTVVDSTNITTFLNVDTGAFVELLSAVVDGPTTGITIDNASSVASVGTTFRNTTTDIEVVDTASILNFVGARLDKNKITFPAGFKGENMLFQDNTEDEEATKIFGDLFIGRPERGTVLCTGQGEPTTRGIIVLTTDGTATSTTDGGNITDVTTEATSFSGSTFSFQGVTANHTILMACTLEGDSGTLPHPGAFIIQTTAAVEVTPRSFIFEYWDGAAWSEITVMSIEDTDSFRYGNEVFIRANTREQIRYNDAIFADWTRKTISGENQFWARIRIATTVTTAPVFQQFRLQANFGEFAEDGYSRFYGKARFRETLLAAGNVYSETGGIANADLPIGSGGIPTGWTHRMNNQQMNGPGDAIYMQFVLPRGIDTSNPLNIAMYYIPEQAGASTDASVIISVLPIEVQGTLEADPAGGSTPVIRTLANTEAVTANTGQATTVSTPIVDNTKLQQISSDPIDISNYYEGDMLFIRIEFDSTGSANKDIFVTSVETNAVSWSNGERLS